MKLISAVVLCSLIGLLCRQAQAEPLTYVYKGGGCTGVAALAQYEILIGRKVDGATDFLDYSGSWSQLLGATNWGLSCWQGKVPNMDVSVPMGVVAHRDGALRDLASGKYNSYYVQIAESLVKHGFPNAFVRVGWEFNGDWYVWAGKPSPSLWAQGFRQVVEAMRSVPGQHFRFVWNPALFQQQFPPDAAYPGDDVVDIVATDAYNASWTFGYKAPETRWRSVSTDPWGLNTVADFARRHHKPLALPEWGTGTRPDGHGGGDDPLFIANMAEFIRTHDVVFQSYWDFVASDYNAQLSGGQYPAALAAFVAEFGSKGAGAQSRSVFERNAGKILGGQYVVSAPSASPQLRITAGRVVPIQLGPNRWAFVLYGSVGAGTLTWDFTASHVELYDPATSEQPIKALAHAAAIDFDRTIDRPLVLLVQQ